MSTPQEHYRRANPAEIGEFYTAVFRAESEIGPSLFIAFRDATKPSEIDVIELRSETASQVTGLRGDSGEGRNGIKLRLDVFPPDKPDGVRLWAFGNYNSITCETRRTGYGDVRLTHHTDLRGPEESITRFRDDLEQRIAAARKVVIWEG